MNVNPKKLDISELKPRITVFGIGGAGGNAVNNMINAGLQGVDFVVANTDAQALTMSRARAEQVIQMGMRVTGGLGAGSQPDVGRAAAEEVFDAIRDHLTGAHMVFVTAGMGGGTGTGASPVVARAARELGILTIGVVTKPFHFEGQRRMRLAESGIMELQKSVDTPPPHHHWITSSAVANSVSGMVRPRALAVLRLMTSSNLVACTTGRSAGLAPLRILPV